MNKGIDTHRRSEKTLDILPTARILFRMTFLLAALAVSESETDSSSELSSSSSFVQVLSTAINMSVTLKETDGQLLSSKSDRLARGLTLLGHEWQTPRKRVHKIWEIIRAVQHH